jgi:hypothetical protein
MLIMNSMALSHGQAQQQQEADETSDEEDNFTLQDLTGEDSLRPRPRPPLAPLPLRGREGGGLRGLLILGRENG